MDLQLNDEDDKYHAAAKRLDVLLNGVSCDVFAMDLYYHKTCYSNFNYVYDPQKSTKDETQKEAQIL